MDWSDSISVAATFIFALGSGGAIVLALSNWIGKLFAKRYVEKLKQEIHQEIESYKTKLKKSEFLFKEEFEATSQFMSLHRSILPTYRHPDMDWGDACEDFASNFADVEEKLERYLAAHGAALIQPVLNLLTDAIAKCSEGKFEVKQFDDVSPKGIEIANKVMGELGVVEKKLRDGLRSQSSI